MSDLTLPTTRPASLPRDTATMIARGVRISRRNLDAMITALMLPVILMLLFVQGGARAHADGVPYSANVPRFAPPLFRCAGHTIDVSVVSRGR